MNNLNKDFYKKSYYTNPYIFSNFKPNEIYQPIGKVYQDDNNKKEKNKDENK